MRMGTIRRHKMAKRHSNIAGAAGILLAALLLTYGNVMMEALFRALGI